MLKNEDGTDFLPMKLAAVLVAASMAMVLAAASALILTDQSSAAEARACGARIAGRAMAEYADGCSDRDDSTLTGLTVPGNVRMIVFGAVYPDDSGKCHSGTYTIRYTDGSSETHIVDAPLGAGIPGPGYGGPLVLYPGRYSVLISIRPVNGTMMALICPEAS